MTTFDQIEHASLTDVGVRRSHNQDNYSVLHAPDPERWEQHGYLFLVADGMGAHAVGEKASEQAAHIIPHIYQRYATFGPGTALRRAFIEANASIHACGQQNREFEGMGTTATGLLLNRDGAWVGHAGDSRCYRIRGNVIEQLSYDHSLVWEYARLQGIDPDEVQDIPPNVIHRCLGPEPLVQPDIEGPHLIEPGDIYLLCSDGLSGQVTDQELGAIASVLSPAEACELFVGLANLRGGPDNITVIIVRVKYPSSGSREPLSQPQQPQTSALSRVGKWTSSLLRRVFGKPGNAVGADTSGTAKVHRRRSCEVDRPLLDKVIHALTALRQRATNDNWNLNWQAHNERSEVAEMLLQQHDLAGAFRECCRALLVLPRHREGR